MKSKIIYIYKGDEASNTYTGEFKIKAFGEFIVMGQSIQAFADGSNVQEVMETLARRMFASLAVMEYAVIHKIPKEEILDDEGLIKEDMGLKILENIPHMKKYETKFEKPL